MMVGARYQIVYRPDGTGPRMWFVADFLGTRYESKEVYYDFSFRPLAGTTGIRLADIIQKVNIPRTRAIKLPRKVKEKKND